MNSSELSHGILEAGGKKLLSHGILEAGGKKLLSHGILEAGGKKLQPQADIALIDLTLE